MDSNSLAKVFQNNVKKSTKVMHSNNSKQPTRNNKPREQSRAVQRKSNTSQPHFSGKITLATLEQHNKYVKNAYNFSAINYKLVNHFAKYPVMPDLYKYYLQWLDVRVQDDVTKKHLQSKKELVSIILSLKDKQLNSSMRRAFRVPTYITKGLKNLVNVAKKAQKDKKLLNKYPSLQQLFKLLLSRATFTKSSMSLLILLGLFKPDDNLKRYLLKKTCKNDLVYQKMITSGYLTLATTNDFSYTTLSYPDNVVVLFNVAGLDMMKKYMDKVSKMSSSEINQKTIESCQHISNFRGGFYESIGAYTSNPVELIGYKLQDALFM